jgi:hypothetical protein
MMERTIKDLNILAEEKLGFPVEFDESIAMNKEEIDFVGGDFPELTLVHSSSKLTEEGEEIIMISSQHPEYKPFKLLLMSGDGEISKEWNL